MNRAVINHPRGVVRVTVRKLAEQMDLVGHHDRSTETERMFTTYSRSTVAQHTSAPSRNSGRRA